MNTTTITIGDLVRSYDFPGIDTCYVEGIVRDIVEPNGTNLFGCTRYAIEVIHAVEDGLDATNRRRVARELKAGDADMVFPPINGLPGIFGTTNGVKLVLIG